jgi:hypothetical protein
MIKFGYTICFLLNAPGLLEVSDRIIQKLGRYKENIKPQPDDLRRDDGILGHTIVALIYQKMENPNPKLKDFIQDLIDHLNNIREKMNDLSSD